MIDSRNIKTRRPMKKLDHKKIGPFQILERIGTRAYRVKLPPTMTIHNVFHVANLEPYRTSRLPGRHQKAPPPEEVEGEKFWSVEAVVKSRWNGRRKRVEYLVKWEGYPAEESTWEPWESLGDDEACVHLIREFHRNYPTQKREARLDEN